MKKRAFIISFERFPRGSAGANYIQYFALALLNKEWDVVVIGRQGKEADYNERIYKGIRYVSASAERTTKNKLYFDDIFFENLIRKYEMSAEDYFIFYNSNIFLFHLFSKKFGTNKMYLIRVEDRQAFQFKLGKMNLRYQLDQYAIRYAQKNMKGIFSISKRLVEQDTKAGGRSMCLPIMADPYEYPADVEKKKGDVVEFIYPGLKATGFEDDITTMILAIAELPEKIKDRIRLHITGTNLDTVRNSVQETLFQKVEKVIVCHGFIPYEELVALFQKSDFLLLIRHENEVTQANFPSKVPEMMAYGIVPICTDVGDYTKDYLSNECAFIVPVGNVEACKEAITKAVEIPNKEYISMRKAGRKLVEQKFFYKNWADEIANFLEENR